MVCGENKRRTPPLKKRREVIERQGNKCFYCGEPFGEYYIRNGVAKKLTIHFDHFVPFAFSGNNDNENFVASCNICNSIKSDKVFETEEDARCYVEHARKRKGIIYLSRMPEEVCAE
jgi:5-methylcytosine-specific restriction endonuclease McrA